MDNLVKFSNDNSDIRKTPVSIIIDYDRNIYGVKFLNYFGKFKEYYGNDNKRFYEALSYAGYILARTNINQFYEVFSLIVNPLEKEALLEGLHKSLFEYSHLLNCKKNIEEDYIGMLSIPPFYPYHKEINSLNNEFLKIGDKMYLNEFGNLEKIKHERDTINAQINVYEKRSDIDRTGKISYIPFSIDIVELSARWLCQCNVDNYTNMLNHLNSNNEYYDLIVDIGSRVAEDLLKLERKCSR